MGGLIPTEIVRVAPLSGEHKVAGEQDASRTGGRPDDRLACVRWNRQPTATPLVSGAQCYRELERS